MTYSGTLSRGTPAFAAGKFGNALTGGVYALPAFPTMTVGTVEMWLKNATSGTSVAFGSAAAGPANLWIGTSSGKATYQPPGGALTAGTIAMNDGAWHHVAVTCDGTNARLWVDGALANTTASAVGLNLGSATAIGGLGTNTSFDWVINSGVIDEVRVSNVVRYTTAFTPPVAAFTSDANTVALYHLEADATDSASGAPPDTTAPTISSFTATAGNTQNVLAWAGTDNVGITRWTVVRGGTTVYDGTATSLTDTGLTNGTAYSYTLTAYDAAGNTATATASATPSAPVTAGTIAPNDTNLIYSPYNWLVGATAKTINPGAYLRGLFTAVPTSLTFDVSNMASPASQIAYRVDGGPWQQATVAASVALSAPAAGAVWPRHTLEVVVKATTETANRWNAPQNTAVVLTGIVCNSTGVTTVQIQKRTLNVAIFGDSITEGVRAINSTATNDTDRNDAQLGWAYRLGDALGAEVGVIGFGATGVDSAGSGNVPAATTSYSLLWAGQSRTFTPTPDLVVINLGQNGGTQAGYTTLLNALIAATPTTTMIAALRPFSGAQAANIVAAVAACSSPARVKYVDSTGWWDGADASDGVHPYGDQNIIKLAPYLAAACRAVLKRGAIYLLGSSGATDKLVTPNRL